jgi:hypothetical protein
MFHCPSHATSNKGIRIPSNALLLPGQNNLSSVVVVSLTNIPSGEIARGILNEKNNVGDIDVVSVWEQEWFESFRLSAGVSASLSENIQNNRQQYSI